MLHPHVLTMFGAGAHENECDAPVRARARKVGSITETKEQNSRRQGDIGIIGVLKRDEIQLIDFTVSDGGSCEKPLRHEAGSLCRQRAAQKHETYHGKNGRFVGIAEGQFVVPSFDQMGGCTEETEKWVLQIVNAVAAANHGTPRAAISRRVWGAISSALMRSIGTNALDFRNGKLLDTSEIVGGGRSRSKRGQPDAVGPSAGRKRRRRGGSQPLSERSQRGSSPGQEEGSDGEYEAQTQSAVGQPEPSEVLAAALVRKAAKSAADRDSRASRRGSSSGTGSASLSVSSQVAATSGAGTHRTRWGDVPRS
jgi:hypothetical protein